MLLTNGPQVRFILHGNRGRYSASLGWSSLRVSSRSNEPIVQSTARPKGEKRRTPWRMLLVILVVLAALVIVPFLWLRPEPDVYTVRTYETAVVESGTMIEYVRGAGTLVPRHERSVLAPGAGVLSDWLVAEGDEVIQGQVLGFVDSPELQREVASREGDLAEAERRHSELALSQAAAVRQAESNLVRLEQVVVEARADLRSARTLYDLGAIPRVDLEAAESALQMAERAVEDAQIEEIDAEAGRRLARSGAVAAVERAHAAVELAAGQVAASELHAPITGRVIAIVSSVGDTVVARSVLISIAGTDDLRVDAEFSEAQARLLSVGQPANLRIAGMDYMGSVSTVAQQAHQSAALGGPAVRTSLVFEEAPNDLRLGASVSIEVEVGRREDAMTLPRGAYLTTGGERLAFVVEGDEARRATVVYGLIDGNKVEVRSGLEVGDRVITSSYEAYREYASVKLASEGEIR